MPRLALALAIATSLHAATAAAATSYQVRQSRGAQFAVVAEGEKILATLVENQDDPVVIYDRLLGVSGAPIIAINSRNETWYELERQGPFASASRYLQPLTPATTKNLKIRAAEVAGADGTRLLTWRIAYDVVGKIDGVAIKVKCSGTFEILVAENHPRELWLGRVLPLTGYPEVDEALSAADATVRHFPLRLSLSATREYEGGKPMTESSVVEVFEIVTTATDAGLSFQVPHGYRQQKPVIGAPGR